MENNKEYLQQIKELKQLINEFVSRKEIITLKEDEIRIYLQENT